MKASIKKIDDELQVVYGEVYAPNVPDAHGDFMQTEEVRKMAHKFMESMALNAVDMNHDNVETGSTVVESFIARKGDPDYIEDAWVVGVHIPDEGIWKKVKSGELNGFSMEALVKTSEKIIEVDVPDVIKGRTLKDESGHTHTYEVSFDDEGNFVGGRTDIVNGHYHDIRKASVTGKVADHSHRFSIMEELEIA